MLLFYDRVIMSGHDFLSDRFLPTHSYCAIKVFKVKNRFINIYAPIIAEHYKLRNNQEAGVMKLREQKGFTLIEVIVVAGIIAILAGILVPLIFKEIDESKITRATADIKSISTAIMVMKKDTGNWPNLDGSTVDCNPTMTLLVGAGNMPGNMAAQGYNGMTYSLIDSYLAEEGTNCYGAKWKGPYMAHVGKDPWGNAYIINADSFSATAPVWIISAGPNGQIDTAANSVTIAAGIDDVGVRIK